MKNNLDHNFLDSLIDPASLYDAAPCGYISFVEDGGIVKINQTLLNWLGYDGSAVTNKLSFTDLVSKGGQIYYEMFYLPLLRLQNSVNEINFEFVRKDRTRFPTLVNSNIMRDQYGKIVVVNVTIFDITDRKLYETELLKAKRAADDERSRFELLSDFLPELIWTADAQGEINYSNKRFTSFFKIPEGSFDPKTIMPMVHSKDRTKLVRNWIGAVRSGKDFETQIRLGESDVGFHWYLVRALPIKNTEGIVQKWMGSCTDIHQQVTAIERMDEFVSVVSHELKTPITSMKASLQLIDKLSKPKADAMLQKLTEQSLKSIGKMNALVDDLLNMGNIKEGALVFNYQKFSVSKLLENTCTHVVADENYKITVNSEPDMYVYGDENRIDQVLINFVNNSIKYAPDAKEIFLTAVKDGENVKISVKDQGPGISAEKIPFVFERYYRINHNGKQYSGLGLGLYISSEIVKKHGGEIGVESELGKGSTFWLSLKLAD